MTAANTEPAWIDVQMRPKLTVGSAMRDDYRAKWTFQGIRMELAAAGLLDQVEFILSDNAPESANTAAMATYLKRCNVRYIPMPENKGTSGPRQRIFEEAEGDAVLVLDAHVKLMPGAITKLLAFYDSHPGCNDLLTGPNLSDDLGNLTTHYNLGWRKEFFGMWGTAWKSPDGQVVSAVDNKGWANFIVLPSGDPAAIRELCVECKYGEHTKLLREAGFQQLGWSDDDDFEIPAMGLGLFSCRREAWVGFHPYFRGFGGGEHYIHAKFRQRGNCTRSLGFLKWWHDYTKLGRGYQPIMHDRLRNTVVGYQELGLSLDDTRRHFVEDRKRLTPEGWALLVSDPLNCPPLAYKPILEDYYDRVAAAAGPLQPHVNTLRNLAARCQHVTEWSKSKGSLAAFAVGLERPHTRLVSYNHDRNQAVEEIVKLAPFVELRRDQEPELAATDLLFVSGRNENTRRLLELVAEGAPVRKYLVLHDVARHTDLVPLCQRIIVGQPQWFVAGSTNGAGGLVVLACEGDRPNPPIIGWLPGYGPGTELKKLLAELGITDSPTCPCRQHANDMDVMGIAWCKENRDLIAGWLREGAPNWGWNERIEAAKKAWKAGLASKLNPFDPYPGLVDEAIRRAEAAS